MRHFLEKLNAALPGTFALAVVGIAGAGTIAALHDWAGAARAVLGA